MVTLRHHYDTVIRKASKRFKTDMHYLTKNGLFATSGQVVVMITSFILSIAFARLISAEQYGTYQYIITLAEFTAVLTLTGLSTSLVKSISNGYDGTLLAAIKLHLTWSWSSVLIGIGISTYYFIQDNIMLGISLLIGVLGTILIAAFKLYIPFLQGKKAFSLSSKYIIIGNLIPSILLLIAVFNTDNILILIATYFISHTCINFLLLRKTLTLTTNTEIDSTISHHSKHTTFQDLILETSGHIDKIMLFQFGSPALLASYVFAVNIPRQFQMLFKSAKSIALPKLTTASYQDLQATLIKKVATLYLIIIPITITYILLAPSIFALLFPQYADAAIYSQVYSLIFLVLPIRIIKDAMLGHDKLGALYKMTVITSICKVITSIILIPLYGIWGVLISLLSTQLVYSLATIWYFLQPSKSIVKDPLP